jgi:diaminohydroxyphosphoribosylaminopyrimidine deaminase/5-amino-6-(5-phosphoribosylamino)uracil reductase
MSFHFAGMVGTAGQPALDRLRRDLGGAGILIDKPVAGFVHCLSRHEGFALADADLGSLLAISSDFPGEAFIWIEVECFGGQCGQQGFLVTGGEIVHIEAPAPDTETDSALQRLFARIGIALPTPVFPPFDRGAVPFGDEALMARALALARRQLGKVAPNPAVGCVIVNHGRFVSEGATGAGGRPHAEESALGLAEADAAGGVAYVSLEPCSARSSGPRSCAQLLIEAKLSRVVIACADPNPSAAHGVSLLGAAGVEVTFGVLREEAEALNAGFFRRVATGRPLLTVDADTASYDAEFDLLRGETFEAALDRMGAAGLTRVFVRPGTALASQLMARGLADAVLK